MRFLVAICAATLALGCKRSVTESVICADNALAAVNIAFVDSLTGAATPFDGVWGRARDGAYVDSAVGMHGPDGRYSLGLAYERAGTYVVTAHANGYQDWVKAGVVVGHDECHVIPVVLTARLVKQ